MFSESRSVLHSYDPRNWVNEFPVELEPLNFESSKCTSNFDHCYETRKSVAAVF